MSKSGQITESISFSTTNRTFLLPFAPQEKFQADRRKARAPIPPPGFGPKGSYWPALVALSLPGGIKQAARPGNAAWGRMALRSRFLFPTASSPGGWRRGTVGLQPPGGAAPGRPDSAAALLVFGSCPRSCVGKRKKQARRVSQGEAALLPQRGGLALRDRGPSPVAAFVLFAAFPTSILGKEPGGGQSKEKEGGGGNKTKRGGGASGGGENGDAARRRRASCSSLDDARAPNARLQSRPRAN